MGDIIFLIMDCYRRIPDQKRDQHCSQPHLELPMFIVSIYYYEIIERNLIIWPQSLLGPQSLLRPQSMLVPGAVVLDT